MDTITPGLQTASSNSPSRALHASESSLLAPQPASPPVPVENPRVSHGASRLLPGDASNESRTSSPKQQPDSESPAAPVGKNDGRRTANGPNQTMNGRASGKRSSTAPRKPICKFFNSNRGCRSGDACPFRHEVLPSKEKPTALSPESSRDASLIEPATSSGQRKTQPRRPPSPKAKPEAVARPVAQTEQRDQRTYQISQLKTRFSAQEEPKDDGTSVLRFGMPPSDPDFPFDIRTLDCVMNITPGRDGSFVPSLRVTNKEMERGYQVNVERGFALLWQQQQRPTLLNSMKMLDKQLESLLTAQKADVIKIVANAAPKTSLSDRTAPSQTVEPRPRPSAAPDPPSRPSLAEIAPTAQRIEAAQARRVAETQNLEHRLGRNPAFAKEAGGTIYTLPIEPRKRSDLPAGLEAVRSIRLYVPEQYDIEPCSIELLGVDSDASRTVEAAFAQRAKEHSEATLMAHGNYLAQNLHVMAIQKPPEAPKEEIASTTSVQDDLDASAPSAVTAVTDEILVQDTDKDHVKRIMRPPEWDARPGADDEDSSGDDEDDDGITDLSASEDDTDNDHVQAAITTTASSSTAQQTGILLTLPSLALHNIELLELTTLSLSVKCSRCRESHDINALKPTPLPSTTTSSASASSNTTRTISCRKCSQPLIVSYTPDLIHAHAHHAANIQLDNCDPLDLLSSSFTPTCATCSTTHTSPGITAARGTSSALAICRGCHTRMSFTIPSARFLRLGSAASTHSLPLKPRKAPGRDKEKLGIVAGTPLPSFGACVHYKRSHRWFRFSCCLLIHPCDKCHDAAPPPPGQSGESKHALEFANRMICGYCSREQNYRPENCGFCGVSLVGRRGKGFWEGGEGTRDPVKMSRRDPRKRKLATKMRKDRAKARERNER